MKHILSRIKELALNTLQETADAAPRPAPAAAPAPQDIGPPPGNDAPAVDTLPTTPRADALLRLLGEVWERYTSPPTPEWCTFVTEVEHVLHDFTASCGSDDLRAVMAGLSGPGPDPLTRLRRERQLRRVLERALRRPELADDALGAALALHLAPLYAELTPLELATARIERAVAAGIEPQLAAAAQIIVARGGEFSAGTTDALRVDELAHSTASPELWGALAERWTPLPLEVEAHALHGADAPDASGLQLRSGPALPGRRALELLEEDVIAAVRHWEEHSNGRYDAGAYALREPNPGVITADTLDEMAALRRPAGVLPRPEGPWRPTDARAISAAEALRLLMGAAAGSYAAGHTPDEARRRAWSSLAGLLGMSGQPWSAVQDAAWNARFATFRAENYSAGTRHDVAVVCLRPDRRTLTAVVATDTD